MLRNRTVTFVLMCLVLSVCHSPVLLAADQVEIEQWLVAHNSYRARHGVPPVSWSATVAASAQSYAETCPSRHSGSGYGENLAWASYDMGVPAVVKMWYGEESRYDYESPGFKSGIGHFTQIIWKGSIEIGCASVSSCGSERSLKANTWVCQYNPPGNYRRQFAENVLRPVSGNDTGRISSGQ